MDPFRWLEDRDSPETKAWIRSRQDGWTEYLKSCPYLDVIQSRVREYFTSPAVDQPARVTDCYLFRRRDKGQEQPSILARHCDTGEERTLLDPSSLGPFVSVAIHHVSADGAFAACELRYGGEDRKSILILDIDSGTQYPDSIRNGMVRGFAFAPDRTGYYYCREEGPSDGRHTIRFHTLGQDGEDKILFCVPCSPGSRLAFMADEVRLGAVLVRLEGKELREDLWVASHRTPTEWHPVLTGRALPFSPFLQSGRILAMSFEDAPNGRLIELSRDGKEVKEILPEQPRPAEQISFSGPRIFAACANSTTIQAWDFEGNELDRIVAPHGSSLRILPNYSHADVLFYTLESFNSPPTIYEYQPRLKSGQIWWSATTPWRSAKVAVRRSRFAAQDGTMIPITVVREHRGHNESCGPMIMTSYGGFGVPATPRFSVFVSILLELGFAFALPHIRGGGDRGKAWHEAGRGRNRPTAIGDFCSAAEWLCRSRLTEPQKLAIFGGSNSGLLVGAAMTRRPELFKAVLCIAPLLDMVGYERLGQTSSWRHEFGTIEEAEDFASLLGYSPYHQISPETNYPSVLFVSGDRDDRCHPAHARKMAARLLSRAAQKNPVLVDYSAHRGHVASLPLSIREAALAARLAFLCRELGVPVRFRRAA